MTITLDDPATRRAVDAAAGGRLVLRAACAGTTISGTAISSATNAAGGVEIVVVARVPSTGSLPTGAPAAVVQVEGRARLVEVHPRERGARYADVDPITEPRPSPRVEAIARELTLTLQVIAELRRSRLLPDLLRSGAAPGGLADSVVMWAEFDAPQLLEMLDLVDVATRVELVLDWAATPGRPVYVVSSASWGDWSGRPPRGPPADTRPRWSSSHAS